MRLSYGASTSNATISPSPFGYVIGRKQLSAVRTRLPTRLPSRASIALSAPLSGGVNPSVEGSTSETGEIGGGTADGHAGHRVEQHGVDAGAAA